MPQELLFSITRKDFDVQYIRGSGKGGQKKNKTSSACRIIHRASGAMGFAQDTRSQSQNRHLAFQRLIDTPEFKRWHRFKTAEASYGKAKLKEYLDEALLPHNLKVEIYNSESKRFEAAQQ